MRERLGLAGKPPMRERLGFKGGTRHRRAVDGFVAPDKESETLPKRPFAACAMEPAPKKSCQLASNECQGPGPLLSLG